MTHRFTNCTFDLRGADYACVSRGDEFEIGHTGEGDRVLIEGDTLDFTGLHILGPVALADRIKAAVDLECYAMATERDALRAEIAKLTADLAESRAYPLSQFFAGRDAKKSKKPERIWARPDYNECWHKRLEEEDVEYVRADLYAAKSAEIARLTAERDSATRAKDCFQRMTRAHWEALCAMRNSINEYIPMPNTDSGPLFSPEDGPIYADIAERVIADLAESRAYALALEQELRDRARLTAERDAALAGAVKVKPDPDAHQADLAKAYGPILDLLPDAVRAAEKAMRKYPQPNYVISKWAEETGEVTKDLIHMAEGRQTADKLRGEIVQSLAMLHRLMVEGDQVHGLPPVGPAIRALTPPADLAAKIGGE